MSSGVALLVLLLAAVLEAGGDALVRTGLEATTAARKLALFAAGAVVLFAYGCAVNAPRWVFGKLLGIYVVFSLSSPRQFRSWGSARSLPCPFLSPAV